MGSSNGKLPQQEAKDVVDVPSPRYNSEPIIRPSQSSFGSFRGSLSGRWSFISNGSGRSTASVSSRPWSRVSRRRFNEATIASTYGASKTAWPVPFIESVFLPDFKIKNDFSAEGYKIVSTISKGSYRNVYKVQKEKQSEIYAMKVISKSHVIRQRAVQQVKDEVIIQSLCCHHPFIVHLHSFWQSRKELYIVTDYVPYGELSTLSLKYRTLPESLVKVYIAELAFALDFLHNAGVIYRDLKLENILLDSEGHIQLIDFGLSKWLKYGHRTLTICGTLQYMAPEILNGQPYTHSVDWWSLGIIAYVLLAGSFPVEAVKNQEEMRTNVSQCDFRLSDMEGETSAAARLLVARLLCKDPLKRLRTLLALKKEALFKDFKFDDLWKRKISPRQILEKHFPVDVAATDVKTPFDSMTEDFPLFPNSH